MDRPTLNRHWAAAPAFAETPLKPTIQKVLLHIDDAATPASRDPTEDRRGLGIRPTDPQLAIALKQRHPKPSNLQHRTPRPAAPEDTEASEDDSSRSIIAPPRQALPILDPSAKIMLDFVNKPIMDLIKYMAEITGRRLYSHR